MHSEATYEENAKSCRLWLRKASGCRTLQESDVIMLIVYGAVGMVVGNIGGSIASSSHRFVVSCDGSGKTYTLCHETNGCHES